MAYAENVAGMAFSNAGLGMVHAMAHALGGHYNLPHGVCNAVLLPYVLRFDMMKADFAPRFEVLADAMGLDHSSQSAAEAVVSAIVSMNEEIGISPKLSDLEGVNPADFQALTALAMHDTCMTTNLVPLRPEDVTSVYTAAYYGHF